MDQKTWLWRKRSSEKTIVATGEEVQIQAIPNQKEVDLEKSLEALNEKLASVLDECKAKDELLQKREKMAEYAIADKQKAEEEVGRLKEELDEVQQQRAAANERLGHLNFALKDCMDQLNLVRKEQEQRVHDAVIKTSKEFEKSHKKLEQKLSETSTESSYLGKALAVKEKLIEGLNNIKSQKEAEFVALMTRLDSVEKENAFLRYEFRTLEKELNRRNEEMEYGHRSAEASHKQHLENVKKIKKLEGDCQRLRSLTRKRLPGSTEEQGRDQIITRRKAIAGGAVYSPENTRKQLSFLIDQVHDLEKENTILKECLAKKEEEVFCSRKVMNLPFQEKLELTCLSHLASDKLSVASGNGTVDSNEITSSRSWAISEPELEPECKIIGASEMSLMDDFVEMEKLAIVAIDAPLGASFAASDGNSMSKELVPFELYGIENNLKTIDPSSKKFNDWLQNVRYTILEHHNVSKRSIDELLGDIRMSLHSVIHPEPSKLLPISGYITWKSPTSSPSSNSIQESSHDSDVNKSISKLIELVGRFESSKVSDYRIHVFRWKSSDMNRFLQEFIHSCNNLIDGKIDFEKFIGDSTSILGWIINNCISYQDHSTVRDEFTKHLGGDGPGTALDLESVQNLMLEMEKMYSVFQVEIKTLKNELNFMKSSNENNEALINKLQQSQQRIASLQNEMEVLKESERTIENLKLINEDLDTQLIVTRAKLSEALQKLSSVEVELDDKSHCCEELEGTCLELQLQLESIASNRCSEDNENEEELLQTGFEITKASAKLAECEETILKLGQQLKSLGSAKELSVVDKVLSITDTKNKKFKQRSSLRDQMQCEDNTEVNDLVSPKTKEIISTTETNVPCVYTSGNCKAFSFRDSEVTTPRAYVGMKNESRISNSGALVILPSKRRAGGVGFWSKLLIRRKKANSKNTKIYFGK